MKTYSRITPEGTRDILLGECRAQREVQKRLSHVFALRGYHEVMTPGLEYYDVFSLSGAALPQQEMYKTTDNHGRLLVVRPDSTLPIARMAASRLQSSPRPLRLFYNQRIYRNRPDLSGRSDECTQMGIELLGASGLRADLEAISLAVEALSACIPDFRVEIGHARLFRALADRLPLREEQREELRDAIESKNYGMLSVLLDPLGNTPAVEAMKRLPRLFGGEEVLREAERWCTDEESREMLASLKRLYDSLKELGLGDRLMVDLGLVQSNDYYTGAVFSAYVQDHGDAILSGGRYDDLCGKFGMPMPAVGFALDLDAAAALLPAPFEEEEKPTVLLYGEPGFEIQAQKLAASLVSQGTSCECSVFCTLEESLEYAEKTGLKKVIRIGEIKEELPVGKGERP